MRKDRVVSEVLGEELAITPSDLYNAEFRSSLVGGYDKNQVDAFLERVADVFESLVKRVRELKDQAEDQKAQIESYRQMETSLRDALVTAQRFSEDVLDSARRQADALVEEARLVKERAQVEASELVGALREEIDALRCERNRLRSDLGAMLDTHRALLDEIPAAEDHAETGRNEAAGEALEAFAAGDSGWDAEPAASPLDIEREPWPGDGDQSRNPEE
jgi:cell division initiation protein